MLGLETSRPPCGVENGQSARRSRESSVLVRGGDDLGAHSTRAERRGYDDGVGQRRAERVQRVGDLGVRRTFPESFDEFIGRRTERGEFALCRVVEPRTDEVTQVVDFGDLDDGEIEPIADTFGQDVLISPARQTYPAHAGFGEGTHLDLALRLGQDTEDRGQPRPGLVVVHQVEGRDVRIPLPVGRRRRGLVFRVDRHVEDHRPRLHTVAISETAEHGRVEVTASRVVGIMRGPPGFPSNNVSDRYRGSTFADSASGAET